jgi:hypothetical protein
MWVRRTRRLLLDHPLQLSRRKTLVEIGEEEEVIAIVDGMNIVIGREFRVVAV